MPEASGGGGGGRQAATVAAGILVTRVLGYVRERVFAYYFGNTSIAADAFRAALRIPNAIRSLLGEGTLSASFIPVYAGLVARGSAGAGAAKVSPKDRNCAVARLLVFREQTAMPRNSVDDRATVAVLTGVQLVPSVLR